MLQIKRGGDDDLIENLESSKKNRTCIDGGETLDSSVSGVLHQDTTSEEQIESDPSQSVWSELGEELTSKLSTNIVSLALRVGHTVVFACSGIAIQRKVLCTRFLTSASLVRAFNDSKSEGHDSLEIQVCREGNVSRGLLGDYNLDKGIALVSLKFLTLGVHPVNLYHQLGFLPCSKVVSVARAATGKLMARSGILTDDSSGSENSDDSSRSENGKGLKFSTCKISEAWEGGALFDYDGNFVGMNLSLFEERTSFLPTSIIIECLEQFLPDMEILNKMVRHVEVQRREIQPWPYFSYPRDRFEDLDSWSYPKQSTTIISEKLILVNNFEDTFGDVYGSGKGVWRQLSKTICHNLPRVVVSLASFSGETRFFACTGLFIEWNGCTPILTSASLVRDPNDGSKIAENLKIEVLLPNKQLQEGTLEHYNLHHNVALVGVKDFCPRCPARILERWCDPRTRRDPSVVAVGRCFKTGVLMATRGRQTDWSGTLDYRDLRYSSCKITKAGIGGPLLDFSGRFVGMNFYDKKIGTPFMYRDCILRVLAQFEGKRTVDKVRGDPVRWPVPMPCWRHPDDEAKDSCPPGEGDEAKDSCPPGEGDEAKDSCPPGDGDDDGEESVGFGFTYVYGERVDYH